MLRSVLNQTLSGIEHILIDNGSTDGSGAMLDAYARAHPGRRISVIHQPNSGMPAYEQGLERACGKYVAFPDSDDYLAPDFCELLYAKAVAEHADICRGEYIQTDGQAAERPRLRNGFIRSHRSEPALFNEMFWTAIYCRGFLDAHDIHFPGGMPVGSDIIFLHRAALCCRRLSLEDRAFYYYRRHPYSMTAGQQSPAKMQAIIYAHRFILESVYRHQTVLSMEAVIHLCHCNIGGLLYYAHQAQNPADAQACRALAMQMLRQCPVFAQKQVVRRLQAAGALRAGKGAPAPRVP